MDMDKEKQEYTNVQRYILITPRDCSLGVISFKKLEWTNYVVQIVNLSIIGVGIESTQKIEPGLIWFKERVGGYKCGVLKWSKQNGPAYRAGVEFVTLSRDEEEYIQEQLKQSEPHKPIPDPQQLMATLVETISKVKKTDS